MPFARLLGTALIAGVLLAAGCASRPTGSDQSGGLQVVVAFYPFQYVAERVAGPYAAVTDLTQPGTEPHDLELTPRQVAGLSDADLVVYQRGFQPAVDQAVEQAGNDAVVETTAVVPLQPLGANEGADQHKAQHEAGSGHEHGSEAGGLDPHVWLDPTNLATIADAVAARLADLDAAHAAEYRTAATALRSELAALDEAYRTGLQDCVRREFVTTHTAFGYLARRYGLTQIGISGLDPEAEPSPARIAAVQREAREHSVTTIFTETLVSPAVAEAIAADLRLRTDVLDPLEGITPQSRGQDYGAVMRSNLTALRTADGCR